MYLPVSLRSLGEYKYTWKKCTTNSLYSYLLLQLSTRHLIKRFECSYHALLSKKIFQLSLLIGRTLLHNQITLAVASPCTTFIINIIKKTVESNVAKVRLE